MDNSVWNENLKKPRFESLNKDINCDILVIGGGMAGVLCAYALSKRGKDVVLVEADEIGAGITQKTTAVITAQHDALYYDLIKVYGDKVAKAYLDANLLAVEEYKLLAKTIDCDFKIEPSYMYSHDKDMTFELDALKSLGYNAELTDQTGLPFPVKCAIKYPEMATFHPLKFLYALSENLKIYEHTKIIDIKGNTAKADNCKINFNNAVVCTHFPFINRTGFFFVKMYQMRSNVIALSNAADVMGTYVELSERGYYFRNYKDYLIVGKGDHRTGTKTNAFRELKDFAAKYYPKSEIKYMWANQDCVTLDGLPYAGLYGNLKDVYVISGFNLWGMTNSMASARLIADLVEGKENEYYSAFRTDRSVLHKQLFINLGVTVKNLLAPTVKRCSHLGCALKYNSSEHSWDCECHGSRFDEGGKLLDNPAKKDIKRPRC